MPIERISEMKRPVDCAEPRSPALSFELVLGAVVAVGSSLLVQAAPHSGSAWSIAAVVLSLLLVVGFASAALPFLLDDELGQRREPDEAAKLQDC